MSNPKQPLTSNSVPCAQPQLGERESAPTASPVSLAGFAIRVVVTVLILLLAYLLVRGVEVLLLAFAGLLFAVFLSSLSQWLSRRTRLPYAAALAAVLAFLVLVIGGLGWLLASRLAAQTVELSDKMRQSLRQIRDYLNSFPWGHHLLEKAPQVAESLVQSGEFARVTGLVSGVASFLVAGVVIVFVGIFGAAESATYQQGLLAVVPHRQRRRVAHAVDAITQDLQGWLVGQVALMLMVGATTAFGLWLLGIPEALTLGLIAGILELIPYVGAWLAAVPSALIALLLGPWKLVMTLALYLGIHILEGYVLAPLVQRRAIHLPPILTLLSQVLLGNLVGVLGLFVAAPLTVSALTLLKLFTGEDPPGDETVQAPGRPIAPANCEGEVENGGKH